MSNQEKKSTNPVAKFVQHLFLDPIKTPAEASARIKELIPYLAGFLGGAILFIVLGNVIPSLQGLFNVLGYICMAGVFVFGFLEFRAIKTKKRLDKLQCEKCKEIINYSGFLGYDISTDDLQILDRKVDTQKGGYDVSVNATERKTFVMHCKCQNCGTEKNISQLFTLAKVSTPVVKNVPAKDVPTLIVNMRNRIQAAYEDDHFNNAKAYDVRVELNLTQEKAIKDFFCDDGSSSKTPIGTITKS